MLTGAYELGTLLLMDPLEELIWHWGMAYDIWTTRGCWFARRNDHMEVLQAQDSETLLFMIRDDYFRKPIPHAPPQPIL